MLVYSRKFQHLTQLITETLKEILVKEVGLHVSKGRFWNWEKTFSYPLSVVIFNHKACLGYFDPEFLELGFHSAWAYKSLEELKDVIRHELAHYLVFIKHGPSVEAHGKEFKELCLSLNWRENVYLASKEFDLSSIAEKEEEKIRKIKKLLALSSSSNSHEAQQALLKARQLMIKTPVSIDAEEEVFYLARILKTNMVDGKMRSIAKICETFFVSCVFFKTKEATYLEILGNYEHVQIAEYVAEYLSKELDNLWKHTKTTHTSIKGLGAKNAFFLGVAKGFIAKVHQGVLAEAAPEKQLVILEKQLATAKSLAYKKLRSLKTASKSHKSADLLGQSCGKTLSVKEGLSHKSSNFLKNLLGFC